MRIGVVSDTHLLSVDDHFRRLIRLYFSDVGTIIHAGDMVDTSVSDFLSEWVLIAVTGNMDGRSVADRFPKKTIAEIGGKRIGVIHGYGSPAGLADRVRGEFLDDAVDCIVFGHTHAPLNETRDGILLFNPGSPTDKRFTRHNTLGYLVITTNDISGEIREV